MGSANSNINHYPKRFEPLFSIILYYFFSIFNNKYCEISEN